jgi:hypothetical protein
MTTTNALVFLLLGLGMIFTPAELPQFFPADAGDGSSTSSLWLGLMGFVNFLLGSAVAGSNATQRLHAAISTWDSADRTFGLPEGRPALPASFYLLAADWRADGTAAPF